MTSNKIVTTGVFLLLSMFFACSGSRSLNQRFSANLRKARSVVVVRPEIDFYFKYRAKDKPKPEYKIEVSRNVQGAIENVLKNSGIHVTSPFLTDSLLIANDNLSISVNQAKQNFIKVCGDIGKSGNHEKFALDNDFMDFARKVQADYVIFVKGWGYQKPRTARNIILKLNTIGYSRHQLNGLFLEVGLVEVSTGEIVWFNRNHDIESDYDPLHFSSVEALCEKLLKNLYRT